MQHANQPSGEALANTSNIREHEQMAMAQIDHQAAAAGAAGAAMDSDKSYAVELVSSEKAVVLLTAECLQCICRRKNDDTAKFIPHLVKRRILQD